MHRCCSQGKNKHPLMGQSMRCMLHPLHPRTSHGECDGHFKPVNLHIVAFSMHAVEFHAMSTTTTPHHLSIHGLYLRCYPRPLHSSLHHSCTSTKHPQRPHPLRIALLQYKWSWHNAERQSSPLCTTPSRNRITGASLRIDPCLLLVPRTKHLVSTLASNRACHLCCCGLSSFHTQQRRWWWW